MRTVKEVSKLTGVSVRTLHYYDEIGLLCPTEKSEAGYRLYDEKALEDLQQILFFREFDLPLKDIKAVMDDPAFDRNRVLRMQRDMLSAKKARLERLIAGIDDILKGDNKMDFQIFSRAEIEGMVQTTIDRMPEALRHSIEEEFGGLEQWREHYLERASREDMQKGYQKLVEWYGGKEQALNAICNPPGREAALAVEKRVNAILHKLAARKEEPLDSFPVRELVAEFGFVMRRFCHVKQEAGAMLSIASSYRDARVRAGLEQTFGPGMAEFFAQAIEHFYGKRAAQ